MRFRNSHVVFVSVLAVLALTAPPAFAQEARGTIVGSVLDPSGAAVPGASVVVTNKAMGTKLALSTNEAGVYQASYLIPGLYLIEVESPGFKTVVRDGVEVRVNDRVQVNITLEIGAAAESITVVGETPLLSTSTASMGQVVDSRRVAELPIAHGQPFALVGLAPGVSFNAGAATLNRPFEPTHIAGYAMSGVRTNRSDITIDGVPSTATANENEVISTYVPPADIVQEFRVQTATFDAQFGNTQGGVINIGIKSGTNELHGAMYYSKWTPALTANDWFNNRQGRPKPSYSYNRWGASAGGPVWIPKLYNGKNRTFFMWGYEGIHESRPRNNCGTTCAVPTEAQWNGDFSGVLAAGGPAYQIYNPFSGVLDGTTIRRQPFPNNQIPASLITDFARKIRQYWPAEPFSPHTGTALGNQNHFNPGLPEPITYYTHTIRGDQNIGDRQRLFVRFSFYKRDSNYNNYLGSIATGEFFKFISRQATLDDVVTLSPTMVLNVRYGYNRFVRTSDSNPGNYGFDLTSLGFSSAYQDAVLAAQNTRFPGISMTGYTSTNHSDFWRPVDTHSFAGTLTKQQGSHSLKTGLELRVYRENQRFYGNDGVGRFTFDANWTRQTNTASAPSPPMGHSVAALLLGLPTSANITRHASYAEQSPTWGLFVQDDWKVSQRLTVNLGLRWEYEGPLTERFNRSITGFDTNFVQPSEAAAQAAYAVNPIPELPASQFRVRGGYMFAGVDGRTRGLYETSWTHFMPRLGLAYQLRDKTVLRAGYGVFFGFLGQRRSDVIQHGFSSVTDFSPTNDGGLTFPNSMLNPFPQIVEPLGAAGGGTTYLNQNLQPFNLNPKAPYEQRWQFGFQQELGAGFVADIAYVGNRGTRIEILRDLNATPRQFLSTSPFRDNPVIQRLSGNTANPFRGVLPGTTLNTSSTIPVERLLRPYPHFGTIALRGEEQGYTWYHSLQASFQKRFSRDYTLMGSYTFSKFMQAVEYLNATDPMPIETISEFDTPHRISISGIWELPFGKGKRFGPSIHPVTSKIISGWQLQGIYVFQSGVPVTFDRTVEPHRAVGSNRGVMFFGDVSTIKKDNPTVEGWFNTAGFVTQSAQLIDTARQLRTFPLRFGWLRQDPLNNWDLSVLKNTAVAEGKNLQIRFEFLNAMNHPNFGGPVTQPTAANFSQITGVQNYSRRIQLTAKFVF
jgi:outer membrane receptor protein involved in Fe transport